MKANMQELIEHDLQEQNIYHHSYIEELQDDDAISSQEAAFLEGYNS
ncbi:MAG: hypothetical protein KC535_01205 [Nanoarchaeota archaeon]|nr:hypothetical protein [Nanoarchaeota archaeon]